MLVSGIGMFKTNSSFEAIVNNIGLQNSQLMNDGYGNADSFEKSNDSCDCDMDKKSNETIFERLFALIKGIQSV